CHRDHGSLFPVGGSLGEDHGAVESRYTVRVLSGNLVNGLAVLADEVSCRRVDDASFLRQSEQMKDNGERQRERERRPQLRAQKALWSALYPGHPYGQVDTNWEQLQRLEAAEARSYLAGHFRAEGALAVVIADAAPAELQRLLALYYADWAGGAGAGPRPPAAPVVSPARAIQLFDRPGASQSTVMLGCRLEPVSAERLPAADLLEAVLTEQAWEIRKEWG